jgi:ribonuclease D
LTVDLFGPDTDPDPDADKAGMVLFTVPSNFEIFLFFKLHPGTCGAVLIESNETGNVSFVLVEDDVGLSSLTGNLARQRCVGVDMEADSMYHYEERVCLLQMSTVTDNFIVDPLKISDLTPLETVFRDPGVKKIFHGADFDIRSLRRDFSFQVEGLFDTQIAAKFLGKGDVGLARLVKEYFGVDLEKKYRKRDWSARPLPREMLVYGVLDSLYLPELARILEQELKERERLTWVMEECEILSRVLPADNDGTPFFMRFKGAGRLNSRSLAVLEFLLRFRDMVAARRNVPHFKVMGNETIKSLIQAKPTTFEDLKATGILSPKQLHGLGEGLVREISSALAIPDADLPVYPSRSKPEHLPGSSGRYVKLKKWRDRRAAEMKLDPPVVLPNSVLKAIADHPPAGLKDLESIPGIRRWQVQLLGEEVCGMIRVGQASSRIFRRGKRGRGR